MTDPKKTSIEEVREPDLTGAVDASGDPDACWLYGEGARVAELPDGSLVPVDSDQPFDGENEDETKV